MKNDSTKYFKLYIDNLISFYEVENEVEIKNKQELIQNIIADYKSYIEEDIFTFIRQNAIEKIL